MVNRELYKDVGSRLLELRKERKFSRQFVADMMHISAKFLYEIEKGVKGFTVQNLVSFANIYDVTTDYIVRGTSAGYCDPDMYEALKMYSPQEVARLAMILKAVRKYGYSEEGVDLTHQGDK